MHFALVSRSHNISYDDLEIIAAAAMLIMNDRFCPTWDFTPITAQAYKDVDDIPERAVVAGFVDSNTVAEALGWHDERNGIPIITVQIPAILKMGVGVLDDNGTGKDISVSSVATHEFFETKLNDRIDDYIQMPDGRFLAKEASDPVQQGSLKQLVGSRPVLVSDAVTPAYFDQQAVEGPFSISGTNVSAPFACGAGGYQIIFNPKKLAAGDPIEYVWGEKVTDEIKQFKMRPTGRSARRAQKLMARLGLTVRG